VWNPAGQAAFLAGAGVLAGVAGTSGAIGSLISYPALLAVGIPALAANVTNAVAVVGSGFGSSIRSRGELEGAAPRVWRWSLLTAAGGAAGASLLLLTPSASFTWIVPFLVVAAAALLLFQPRIYSWRDSRPAGSWHFVVPAGLIVVALYEGYFGAASGVMTLALLMITVETRLPQANAMKNLLLGVADLVAAIGFSVFGPVHWAAALSLGGGFVVGGTIGPSVTRRVRPDLFRIAISIAGFGLGVWLFLQALGA
jgi:uncharacterized protein